MTASQQDLQQDLQQEARQDLRQEESSWPGERVEDLLRELATWGNTTTIVVRGGSVFEFKGPFPEGVMADGYYNLHGLLPGFHGHLRLDRIARVRFQEKTHRGRASYAFCFDTDQAETVFRVFLGRDDKGDLIPGQLAAYEQLKGHARALAADATVPTETSL